MINSFFTHKEVAWNDRDVLLSMDIQWAGHMSNKKVLDKQKLMRMIKTVETSRTGNEKRGLEN